MRETVVAKYGPPDGILLTELEKPSPKDNHESRLISPGFFSLYKG